MWDLAKVRILAGTRIGPRTGGDPACPEVSVGEAIIGVIGDGCSSREGAANACRTTSRTAAKGGIGGSDRRQSAVRVQKVRVTNVVFVDGQQSVRADVPQIVHRNDGARLEFMLDTDIHLIGAR